MSAPSLQWIPFVPVLHLHRYYGLLRLLLARPGSLRSPLTTRYRSGRRRGGLPRSWGIPLRACPGLATPAVRPDPRLAVLAMRPSVEATTSASATRQISELNPRGPLLVCLRFTWPVARRRCKTHYRPARYGVDRAGFASWTPFRGFTCSCALLPCHAFVARPNRTLYQAEPRPDIWRLDG